MSTTGFEEWLKLPANTGFSTTENTLVTPNEIKGIYQAGWKARKEVDAQIVNDCKPFARGDLVAHILNLE